MKNKKLHTAISQFQTLTAAPATAPLNAGFGLSIEKHVENLRVIMPASQRTWQSAISLDGQNWRLGPVVAPNSEESVSNVEGDPLPVFLKFYEV